MAIPALVGYALDSWLETRVVFTAIGAILGLLVGMFHLIRLANPKSNRQNDLPSKR